MFTKILHRPALAIVISLLLMFLGGLSIATLPISQFPSVAPPMVVVFIAYPGASAKVLEESVLIPLEASINGVQDMKYMTSDATSAGEATIQVIFELGTDPNQAVVNVMNRVDQVKTRLPPLVRKRPNGTVIAAAAWLALHRRAEEVRAEWVIGEERLPSPWRERLDVPVGVLADSLQDVDQVSVGIDTLQPAGRHQALHGPDVLGTHFSPAEHPVLASHGDGPQRPFEMVGVERDRRVTEIYA
jgi:Cu/Ag efflux pump CusA